MKTIMVVDEDESVLENIKSVLGKRFNVSTAKTNREAIEALEEGKVDMLLVHTSMDGEDVFTPIISSDESKMRVLENTIPRRFNEEELARFLDIVTSQ
ncbi:MAG TPA: response regulator [Thermoplasmatales archaeon]|nr:response regulator [Thermoplasmatales archaeon]